MEHTPGEWKYLPESRDYMCEHKYKDCYSGVIHGGELNIAIAVIVNDCVDGTANAERIVKAVNCHDDLVEALEAAKETIEALAVNHPQGNHWVVDVKLIAIKRALSKAESL